MQASGAAWKEGQLDFTGAQMVLTLRLIAVAVRCTGGPSRGGVFVSRRWRAWGSSCCGKDKHSFPAWAYSLATTGRRLVCHHAVSCLQPFESSKPCPAESAAIPAIPPTRGPPPLP